MSVLIKGTKMPNSCLDCPCSLTYFSVGHVIAERMIGLESDMKMVVLF